MNKKATQLILIIFVASFAIPNLVFASWWNPFSWSWFSKSVQIQPAQVITAVETPTMVSEPIQAEASTTRVRKESPEAPLPCDQECLEHQAFLKRSQEEMKKQEAVTMENERIRQASIANPIVAEPVEPKTTIEPLTVSCTPTPSTINAGETVTWTTRASGGIEPYRYSWVGTAISGIELISFTKQYPDRPYDHFERALITVTSFDGQHASANCTVKVKATTK